MHCYYTLFIPSGRNHLAFVLHYASSVNHVIMTCIKLHHNIFFSLHCIISYYIILSCDTDYLKIQMLQNDLSRSLLFKSCFKWFMASLVISLVISSSFLFRYLLVSSLTRAIYLKSSKITRHRHVIKNQYCLSCSGKNSVRSVSIRQTQYSRNFRS